MGLATKSLDQIRQLYYDLGTKIFASGSWYALSRWMNYYRTGDYYSGPLMEELIKSHFGEFDMCDLNKPEIPKLFVVATDVSEKSMLPYLFRTYDNPMSTIPGRSDVSVVKALRATSAAPTYFSSIRLEGKEFIDGGMIANNPAELALFEASFLWPESRVNL
mgnify:CR=1 FL=1